MPPEKNRSTSDSVRDDGAVRYVRGEISARDFISAQRQNAPDYGSALLAMAERHRTTTEEERKAASA